MNCDLYYSGPTQVRFYDAQRGEYVGGIANHDYVISGIDGWIIGIGDIIRLSKQEGINEEDAIIELSWKNLSKFIKEK